MFYLRKASEKMISTRLNMTERARGTSFTAKSLFEGLSGAQLTAGALAAVTSMLLSAQIGIAGSVIGVAVGSVVSTVASQVYKRFLEQSATKLRGMRDSDEESSTDGVGVAEGLEGFEAVPLGAEKDVRADGLKAGQTEQAEFAGRSMRAADQLASGRVIAGGVPGRATATPHLGDKSLAGDITAQHVREKREHDKRMQRGVIAVSIVSALVAVAVSAGFVMLTTQGQGLGAKPAAIEQVVRGNQDSDAQQDAQADKQHAIESETSSDSQNASASSAASNTTKNDSSDANSSTSQNQSGSSQSGAQESGKGQSGPSTSSSPNAGTSSSGEQGSTSGGNTSSSQDSASGSSSASGGTASGSSK